MDTAVKYYMFLLLDVATEDTDTSVEKMDIIYILVTTWSIKWGKKPGHATCSFASRTCPASVPIRRCLFIGYIITKFITQRNRIEHLTFYHYHCSIPCRNEHLSGEHCFQAI